MAAPAPARALRGPRKIPIHVIGEQRRRLQPLLLLFGFLVALYAATSGGYPSSVDDDSTFYGTQGLIERGSPALPSTDRDGVGAWIGPDGLAYPNPSRGILTMLLAAPFYVVGDGLAQLFEPRFHDYVARMAATALSTLETAATAVAVGAIALELGAAAWGAVGVGLLFGVSTIAWPYSKYLWSEPTAALMLMLAVLCAFRAARRGQIRFWAGSSIFGLLAVLARPNMVLCLPLLLGYACVSPAHSRRRWRELGLRLAAFLGPLLPLALPLLLIGAAAWGWWPALAQPLGPAITAIRGLSSGLLVAFQPADWARGVLGLLISPGKGALLYSPPLIAGLVALPALWRRAWREAALLVGLFVINLLFIGSLAVWHGDDAWGPRYMVPFTACLMLPLAAWLGPGVLAGWRKALVLAAAALGTAVQLLGGLANYHTYIAQTHDLGLRESIQRRAFDPGWSPLLTTPRQLVSAAGAYLHTWRSGEFGLTGGLYFQENDQVGTWRWSDGQATLEFIPEGAGPLRLDLSVREPDLGWKQRQVLPAVAIALDGQPLSLRTATIDEPAPLRFTIALPLPLVSPQKHTLAIRSATFIPAEEQGSGDIRLLGSGIISAQVSQAGTALRPVHLAIIPPLDVAPSKLWGGTARGWFYSPFGPQLLDIWPWYVTHSGLPPILALLELIPLAGIGLFGWQMTHARGRPLTQAAGLTRRTRWAVVAGLASVATATLIIATVQSRSAPVVRPRAPVLTANPLPPLLAGPGTLAISGSLAQPSDERDGVEAIDLYVDRTYVTSVSPAPSWQAAIDRTALPVGHHQLTAMGIRSGGGPPVLFRTPLSVLGAGHMDTGQGWYPPEGGDAALLPAWTDGHATVQLRTSGPLRLRITFQQYQESQLPGRPVPNITFRWDGSEHLPGGWSVQPGPNGYLAELDFNEVTREPGAHTLEIISPPFIPGQYRGNDGRSLGLYVTHLEAFSLQPLSLVGGLAGSGSLLPSQSAARGQLLGP